MNILDATEKIKSGEKITKSSWNGATIQAVTTDNGEMQLFATGETTADIILLLSNDFEVVSE